MRIEVRYFAAVREKLGPGESLSWPHGEGAPASVAELKAWLCERSPAHAKALNAHQGLRTALNQTMCKLTTPLVDGAEVAFFPPVTGG